MSLIHQSRQDRPFHGTAVAPAEHPELCGWPSLLKAHAQGGSGGQGQKCGHTHALQTSRCCLSWALFLQFLPLKIPAFGVFTLKIITIGTRRKTSATSQQTALSSSSVLPKNLLVSGLGGERIRKQRGGRRTSAWEHTAMTSWLELPSLPQVTPTAVQGVAASCLLGA